MTTLLECLDSDADTSVVIVRLQWLNQLQNYSRDTSKYRSLRMRPRQDYTDRVMLNDCVKGHIQTIFSKITSL